MLKGHWGRYHRSVATGEFANVLVAHREAHVLGSLRPRHRRSSTTWPSSKGRATSAWTPTTRRPAWTSIALSLERELAKSLGVSASYTYKRGREYAGWQDTAGTYVQVPFTDNLGDDPTGTPSTCSAS